MQATGLNSLELSQQLFTIEYFSYHSVRYGWRNGVLPSQKYAIHLLEEAIARGAEIIVMRGKSIWMKAVPELKKYSHAYVLKSPQNVIISEGNLGQDAFSKVVRRIRNN